jgi:hypothetical protein
MQVLASLTVRAISSLMVLLAWLSLILDMGQDLSLKFLSTVSEAALVTELAAALEFPVLAHFGLVLSSVLFDELASFLWVGELFTFGAYINLKGIAFRHVH